MPRVIKPFSKSATFQSLSTLDKACVDVVLKYIKLLPADIVTGNIRFIFL